jgi:hypothetical protein
MASSSGRDEGVRVVTANFAANTLGEENEDNAMGPPGWNRLTLPTGPGPDPAPAPVAGSRGEPNFDSDPSYGPSDASVPYP